ncbi:MAG TPA: Lrp/AsnC family transcriptional regulator [Firmicutes bacterium]|nr:Lrp/AsnC family transcriptional regulator [Bacillota bacterium]
MDLIDTKILSLLEQNARIPLKKIAEQVFLSAPAVSARIERLERAGVITGYRAVVNPRQLGYHISAFVNVILSPERQKPFFSFVEGCRNVTECYHVAGPYSMLMKVNFPDTQQLDSFVARVQKFGKTQTQIVFSTVVQPREVEFSPQK